MDTSVIPVGRQRLKCLGGQAFESVFCSRGRGISDSRSRSQSCRKGACRRIPLETIRWAVSNTKLGAVGPRGKSRIPRRLGSKVSNSSTCLWTLSIQLWWCDRRILSCFFVKTRLVVKKRQHLPYSRNYSVSPTMTGGGPKPLSFPPSEYW